MAECPFYKLAACSEFLDYLGQRSYSFGQRTREVFCMDQFGKCARHEALKVKGLQVNLENLAPWAQDGLAKKGSPPKKP